MTARRNKAFLSRTKTGLAGSGVRFNVITLLIMAGVLSIVGFFVVKIFAATPAAYPCNSPFPTVQSGTKDATGGRTDKCVTAIQQIFYVKTSYRLDRTGIVDAPTLSAIKAFQAQNGVAQTGVLAPNVVGGIPAYFGYSGYAFSTTPPTNPPPPPPPVQPPPPPPPIGCEETDTCPIDLGGGDGGIDQLPTLGEVNIDQLSGASDSEIQNIIDDSLNADSGSGDGTEGSGSNSQKVLRTYGGKLKLFPPQATTEGGATQIRYYIDGKLKNTAKKSPYAYTLDTTRLANKRHILTVASYTGSDKLTEDSYLLSVKNNLNFWQKLYNLITAPFAK